MIINLPYAHIEETNIYVVLVLSQFFMTKQIIRMNINYSTSVIIEPSWTVSAVWKWALEAAKVCQSHKMMIGSCFVIEWEVFDIF